MSSLEIVFISKDEALELHYDSIERFGGSHGLRDEGAFESALRASENRHYYESADLMICAATYAFHLTQAHAFIDGNKRIGAASALLFLARNNAELIVTNQMLIDLFLKIAAGEMSREEVEQFFLQHVKLKS
ncbi:MAG: type II toxin-antitoxin system death-on-curing family toxin [Pyrinomonadaceae bacterium]